MFLRLLLLRVYFSTIILLFFDVKSCTVECSVSLDYNDNINQSVIKKSVITNSNNSRSSDDDDDDTDIALHNKKHDLLSFEKNSNNNSDLLLTKRFQQQIDTTAITDSIFEIFNKTSTNNNNNSNIDDINDNETEVTVVTVDCDVGYYYKQDTMVCEECPIGTYSNSIVGTTNNTSCITCDDGEWTNGQTGQSICVPCNAGTYGISGTCTPCQDNFYQPQVGQTECIQCNAGGSVNDAKTECNYYNECPTGTYYSTREGGCIPCDAGTYGINGTCTTCLENFYQPDVGQTECIQCNDGGTVNDAKTECIVITDVTPPNSDNNINDETTVSVVVCDDGYYNIQDICEECPAGTYSTGGNLCITCDDGYSTNQQTGQSSCVPCDAGNYGLDGTCTPCQDNFYQPESGQTECIQCNAGGIVNDLKTECNDCPTGTYSTGQEDTCITCDDGYWTNGQVGQSTGSCVPCDAGMYGTDGICNPCQGNFYQPNVGQTECIQCKAGSTVNDSKTECNEIMSVAAQPPDKGPPPNAGGNWFLDTLSATATFDIDNGSYVSTKVAIAKAYSSTDNTRTYSLILMKYNKDKSDCGDTLSDSDGLTFEGFSASDVVSEDGKPTMDATVTVDLASLSEHVYTAPESGQINGEIKFCQQIQVINPGNDKVMNQVQNIIVATIQLEQDFSPGLSFDVTGTSVETLDAGLTDLEANLLVYYLNDNGEEVTESTPLTPNDVLRFRITTSDPGVTIQTILDATISGNGDGDNADDDDIIIQDGFITHSWVGIIASSCSASSCDTTIRLPYEKYFGSEERSFSLSGTCLISLGQRRRHLRELQPTTKSGSYVPFQVHFKTYPSSDNNMNSSSFSIKLYYAGTSSVLIVLLKILNS